MGTKVVLTLSVLGSILPLALGQIYGYANHGLGNRRVQPFFVHQQVAPRLPGIMLGQRRQANPLGGAFRGIPLGGASPFAASGAASPFLPQQSVQGVGGDAGFLSAATTPTTPTPQSQPSRDQKKLVDMLVHVITKNHEAKLKAQTTPAPVASARSHPQPGSAESNSHVTVHSHQQNRQPNVHVAPLGQSVRNPLAQVPDSRLINSQATTVPDSLSTSSGLPETSHRYAAVPDVLNSMPGSNPTRQNHRSTHAEHNLQVISPLQSGNVDVPHKPNNLPRFLTGENKKTTQTRHVNSALLKPTHMSVVPIRKQIPPPSQTTQPTYTKPFTQAFPEKEEDEEQVEEEEPERSPPLPVPSGQRPNFTQLTPPNSQIPAPRPVPVRPVPTTQEPMVTSVSASTPTTMPVPRLIPGAINPFENQHVVKPPGQ
ncbi:mediator of DNA damage checkpoint protein 1-like [Haliotis asinina]|uniref:mediator of DNA damage checkpoint protein 1-like n=1 Tax=Haliotis asinina TaxID=109174 RepID=UPI003531A5BA